MQLPLDCWEHLKADNGVPDWASAHRTYSGAPGLGLVPACSGEDWGPFLGQTLISILEFVVAVVCCLPAREDSIIFLQCCLPSRLALRVGFVPALVPPLWSVQWDLGHSPLAVSNISPCGLNSHDSGSSGQCLFLHQAHGKYLVSPHLFKTSQAGILILGSGFFYLFVSKQRTQLFLTKTECQSLLT